MASSHTYLCNNTSLHFVFGALETKLQTSVHFLLSKFSVHIFNKSSIVGYSSPRSLFVSTGHQSERSKSSTEKEESLPVHLRRGVPSFDSSRHCLLSLRQTSRKGQSYTVSLFPQTDHHSCQSLWLLLSPRNSFLSSSYLLPGSRRH